MSSMDNMMGMVKFFSLAIAMIIVLLIWNTIYNDTGLEDNILSQTSVGSNAKARTNTFFGKTDNIVMFVYFGLHLGIIVLAFLLRSHPIMYVVGILMLMMMMLVSPILSNAYVDVVEDDTFADVAGEMSITKKIMENLPKFELIWGIFSAIVMYGFARYEGLI